MLLTCRKDSAGAVWLAAGTGLLIAAVSGLPDLNVLWSSTAPFAWSMGLAQALVTLIVGLGLGMALALPAGGRGGARRQRGAAAATPLCTPPQQGVKPYSATDYVLDMQTNGTPYFNTLNGGAYQQWD